MEPNWEWHCFDFAAAHLNAVTGRDVWAEIGAAPRCPRQAVAIMRRIGARTLKDAVSRLMGAPVDPQQAMRGDLAMVDNALGIVRGEWVECLDRMQPIGRASCCWSVPRCR